MYNYKKEDIIQLTTKNQVEDFFKSQNITDFKQKENILKDVMSIDEVFDVPGDYTDEDNYLAILSAFVEGSWRLF
ncbi:hypothetical protein BHAMNSH16_08675 [Brachyspira hampsonii]|uniref:Uncharacterized protein n=1 Tax=Brachyspira hampsonii TaxID=1287055 RepID=A0AAC9TTP0_9SPIR|nr:hypothetical protein [Brachyspira hampsonii]ASJ21708.1 hypothetical protein BHAMNSH16_08675 [Brachyspira hampsonii]MBW5380881.1 hypothetical protein [Brachyspira hampsonii]OEJ18837.1 hypothetical protein A9496_06405 [Brachyspira hampsonii]